jgi:predicted nucleic acid-binding protein
MMHKSPSRTRSVVASRPVEGLIHIVRGHKVMLDSDMAALYGVPTKRPNEAVKRNLNRFPPNFMFQLTQDELASLRSQIATSRETRGGRRYLSYVFTEHGVVMLSAVLNSERAVQMSVLVVSAFIRMRELIAANKDIAARIDELERGHDRTASVIEVRECSPLHQRELAQKLQKSGLLVVDCVAAWVCGSRTSR